MNAHFAVLQTTCSGNALHLAEGAAAAKEAGLEHACACQTLRRPTPCPLAPRLPGATARYIGKRYLGTYLPRI